MRIWVISTSPEATPEGRPTVTVATALPESNSGPAFTKLIDDDGVAVAVGVGGTGVWVGVGVTGTIVGLGVAVGDGTVVAVAVAVGGVPDGISSTASPLMTGAPIGAPVLGN